MDSTRKERKAVWGWGQSHVDKHGFWYYVRLLIVALILAFAVKESVVEAYRIPSESMENTLLVGDFLMANKFIYGAQVPLTHWRLPALREPKAGDVVVFRFPEDRRKSFVKRIVAVGGDTVEIISKKVFVNHAEVPEPPAAFHFDAITIPRETGQPRDNYGPLPVPEGSYFVLGDNRDNSADSRYWGCVPRNLIIGKAFLIHWSWCPDGGAPEVSLTKPLSILNNLGYNIRHLSSRVRWNRLFTTVS